MPFIEFVLAVLGIAFIIAFWCAFAAFWVAAALIAIAISLAVGWIPILMVWSDPGWTMSFSGNFIEAWSAWSLLIYIVSAIGYGFFYAQRDDLPPFLKAYAWLFPHPAQRAVNQGTQRSLTANVPVGDAFDAALGAQPSSPVNTAIKNYQLGRMTTDLQAEAKWAEEQARVKREAVMTNIKRAEADELAKHAERTTSRSQDADNKTVDKPPVSAETQKRGSTRRTIGDYRAVRQRRQGQGN